MAPVVVGNRRLLNSDVLLVSCSGYSVELDPATLQKCDSEANYIMGKDKSSAALQSSNPDTMSVTIDTQDKALPLHVARAAILARIAYIMQCRSGIRNQVCTYLTQLLNASIVPLLPLDTAKEGDAVIDVLFGNGYAYADGVVTLKEALAKRALAPLAGLTSSEISTLRLRSFVEVGTASLCCAAATNALDLSDAVAALSLEASHAPLDTLQAVHFDICRPHRGQMDVAQRLRLLTSNSRALSSGSKPASCLSESLRTVPQYHGPARESILAASRGAEIELNSAENGPLVADSCGAGPYNPQQAQSINTALATAILSLAKGSKDRSLSLSGGNGRLEVENNGEAWSGAVKALQVFENVLGEEMAVSLETLQKEETRMAEKVAQKQAQKAAKMPAPPANHATTEDGESKDTKGGGAGGPVPPMNAKQLAKQKEKAEKAAAKAAEKAAKKNAPASYLGDGTSVLKRQVLIATGGDTTAVALSSALDPYKIGNVDVDIGPIIAREIERLGSGGAARKPKLPKGTRDQLPEQMRIREQAFNTVRRVFKRHGGVEIDTPVFELKETLTGKYGEDSKLIYDLADQGGELLSLRYDLTVPFARYLALNAVGNIKRFHIAKVYRRDQPNMARGRYREFYQCDFDIAGNYSLMVPDSEVLSAACEILSSLPIGEFQVKLNHRRLLDAILDICGCPAEKFRPICSAIDKLDKLPWEEVRREMVEEKGLSIESANKIGTFVTYAGEPRQLWSKLKEENKFGDHPDAKAAMDELNLLFDYLEAMDTLKYIHFDLSLARGLTYYTGLIYECIVLGEAGAGVGSIAAGGRYDGLVGMFSTSSQQTPCVGVSIGIERVFSIMEAREKMLGKSKDPVSVYVAGIGQNLLLNRMKVARILWSADIVAEFNHSENPKLKPQLTEVLERGIPFMLIIGEEEANNGVVKLKDLTARTEETVALDDIVSALISKGCKTVRDEVSFGTSPTPTHESNITKSPLKVTTADVGSQSNVATADVSSQSNMVSTADVSTLTDQIEN